MPRYIPLTMRLLEKIGDETSSGCWPWMGAKTRRGYGHVKLPGTRKNVRVIRLLCDGLDDGTVARHTCDNPKCVNPMHLLPGTQAANMQDASLRGRCPGTPGPRNGKTSIMQRQEIRERYALGEQQAALASEYGVTQKAISAIIRGRNAPRCYKKYHSTETVANIREAYSLGATQPELAKRFGLGQSTISRIVRGESGNSERREAATKEN